MTKAEVEILLFVLITYLLWSLLNALSELITSVIDWFTPEDDNDQKWLKNAPYTTLVHQAIFYTNDILYNLRIDHFPSCQIYYYRHKKHFGQFDGEVKIYTKNHHNIVDLVDTVLHEVKHFIQSETDPDFDQYETYTKQLGEWNNPFEVEAREFASEHLEECLEYLEERGLVLRG